MPRAGATAPGTTARNTRAPGPASQALGLSLTALAGRVRCAKSYLSSLENGKRAGPPSMGLLARLARALEMTSAELEAVARWQSTPEEIRRSVLAMGRQQQAARELVRRLGLRDGPGRARAAARSLDELYRSGDLKRLVERVDPSGTAASEEESGDVRARGRADDSRQGEEMRMERVLPMQVPVINAVAAGYPASFTDMDYPARVADEYVRTIDVGDSDAFAARVVGDSMEPLYREGDIVVFSPAKRVTSGMDCFVRLEPDHESTFKRVFFEEDEAGVGEGGAKRKKGVRGARGEAGGARARGGVKKAFSATIRGEAPRIVGVGEGAGMGGGVGVGRGAGVGGEGAGEGGMIRLQPLNAAYAAQVVARERVAGMYAAVSVTRAVG